MTANLRVLVEVNAACAKAGAAALNLPGFVATLTIATVDIRSCQDASGERGYVVRGLVSQDTLAELRRHTDVLDVYLDANVYSEAPVVPFPVSDEQIRARPLGGTCATQFAVSRTHEP